MISAALYSSRSEQWATPRKLFAELDAEFHFNLDPCATPENAKCADYFTEEQDGLAQSWAGRRVFCNPPYGRKIGAWVRKCYEESSRAEVVVMLIPARTDTAFFHDYIYHKAKEVRFLRGRLHYNEAPTAAPFPSMVVIF